MKKHTIVNLFLVSILVILYSCNKDEDTIVETEVVIYEGDFKPEDDEDLNEFLIGGYTIVDGNVELKFMNGYLYSDPGVSSIQSLINLSEITGNLTIGWNSSLQSLEGLNNLRKVGGDLEIENNSHII